MPAYGKAPYLPALLNSLMGQSAASKVIVCTSTPTPELQACCNQFAVPLFIREGMPGLKDDWNFAYEKAAEIAELVTIAHQDDIYYPEYASEVIRMADAYPDMVLFCCRYDTIDELGMQKKGSAESVKRILRLPLRNQKKADSRLRKRLALSFGNSIGCPTCTYNTKYCSSPLFRNEYKFVTDWETLLRLAEMPGRFVAAEKPLMAYRVHRGAETMRNIENHNREREEREIFTRLHGSFAAGLLMWFYKRAYKAYDGEKKADR